MTAMPGGSPDMPGCKLGKLPGTLPASGMPGVLGRNFEGLGESTPSTGGPGLASPESAGIRGLIDLAGARLSREPKREC